MQSTPNTSLQAETLSGDVRDILLTHVRSMETPWSKMTEAQQRSKIEAIERCAQTLVCRAVIVVANQGFPHLSIRLGKWSVNGDVKIEVTGAGTSDNITKLAEHGPGEAILVLTEVGEYFGQREAARAQPDQPDLPIDGQDDSQVEEEGEEEASGQGAPTPVAKADREFGGEGAAEAPAPRRQRRAARETVAA